MRFRTAWVFVSATLISLWSPVPGFAQTNRWPSDPASATVRRDTTSPAQCVPQTPVLMPRDSLGPIKPGFTLAEIEETCAEVEYAWLYLEGLPTPVVVTRLGEMTVLFEMTDTLSSSWIYRATTASPLARTVDGVGPGLDLAIVSQIWPDLRLSFEEGLSAHSRTNPAISLWIGNREDVNWEALRRVNQSGDWSSLPEGLFVEVVALNGLSHRCNH